MNRRETPPQASARPRLRPAAAGGAGLIREGAHPRPRGGRQGLGGERPPGGAASTGNQRDHGGEGDPDETTATRAHAFGSARTVLRTGLLWGHTSRGKESQ